MTRLKLFLMLLILPVGLIALSACENNDVEEDEGMPYALRQFADQYFQGREIEKYNKLSNGNYQFTISNGPTITVSVAETTVNPPMKDLTTLIAYQGNGETMPQNMAWNCLPTALYDYIDGLEYIDCIYSMEIRKGIYYVSLFDTDVQYDSLTGTITET